MKRLLLFLATFFLLSSQGWGADESNFWEQLAETGQCQDMMDECLRIQEESPKASWLQEKVMAAAEVEEAAIYVIDAWSIHLHWKPVEPGPYAVEYQILERCVDNGSDRFVAITKEPRFQYKAEEKGLKYMGVQTLWVREDGYIVAGGPVTWSHEMLSPWAIDPQTSPPAPISLSWSLGDPPPPPPDSCEGCECPDPLPCPKPEPCPECPPGQWCHGACPEVLRGDVNGDGIVDNKDLGLLMKLLTR